MFMNADLPAAFREKQLADVIIFKTGGEFWAIGQNPDDFERWCKMYLSENYTNVERVLTGLGLSFMSQVIYVRDTDGWKCMKNRFLTPPPMPFSSLDEARLKCAALGWPDPMLLAVQKRTA